MVESSENTQIGPKHITTISFLWKSNVHAVIALHVIKFPKDTFY